MNNYLLVMIGGALGSAGRYGLSRMLPTAGWPWPTLAANLIGGLCMGLLMGWLIMRGGDTEKLRLFFAVGVLGGFTTFSAFSLEVAHMLMRRDYAVASAYIFLSVALSVGAVMAGLSLFRRLSL